MCSYFVACFVDFDRTPRGAHDFGRTPRGAHDATHAMRDHNSRRATRGTGVPALPAALLTSPSGCAGATATASTSEVTIGEGHTCGTSGHPSSDDHVGEVGLLATNRQTHHVSHFGVDLVTGALLRLRCPHRSELAPHHGRRIYCLDRQQHMRSCPSPRWL
jgi:hypothetical protein